jgi:hypothetical protein
VISRIVGHMTSRLVYLMSCLGQTTLRVVCWVVCASALCAGAQAAEQLAWDDLRPPAAVEDNPFSRLTPAQTELITELALSQLMEQRGRPVTQDMLKRREELVTALAAHGYDAAALLRARDALIAARRSAATATVAALDGREIRLPGYLVPASADGKTVTDFLLVPWAGACSHTPPPPPNQIVRVAASALPGVEGSPFDPVQLTGQLRIREQESNLLLVDGLVTVRSAYTAERVRVEALAPRAAGSANR